MIVRGNIKTHWVEVYRAGVQPEIFQGRGCMKLEHSDKRVVKNPRKDGPAGKSFEAFSLR